MKMTEPVKGCSEDTVGIIRGRFFAGIHARISIDIRGVLPLGTSRELGSIVF